MSMPSGETMPALEDRRKKNDLEGRVDDLENRVAVIETTVNDMRRECNTGFSDLKQQLMSFWGERKEWGEFARTSLREIGKWFAKWGTIILIAAIGFNHIDDIVMGVKAIFRI